MTSALTQPPPASPPRYRTAAEWLRALGDVPLERILFDPLPGTATEKDLLRLVEVENVLCELVDGTLVEKPVGFRESLLAGAILAALRPFVTDRNLGLVSGADSTLRMRYGNIRLPDVVFIAWDDIPQGEVPRESVPQLPPTLAVEVLSATNARREMQQKREEYFASGTRLVWEFDPQARCVAVYTSPDDFRTLRQSDVLDGGDVLPGLKLPLGDLFAAMDIKRPG